MQEAQGLRGYNNKTLPDDRMHTETNNIHLQWLFPIYSYVWRTALMGLVVVQVSPHVNSYYSKNTQTPQLRMIPTIIATD